MSHLDDRAQGAVRVVLTIAGSDSSGGAGIQADLKTFSALGVHGMSVVTAVTAQNTLEVSAVFDPGPGALCSQLDAVLADARPDAVKIGMIHSAANARVIADRLSESDTGPVVLDPILRSSSGRPLVDPGGPGALRESLFPVSTLVTPNLDEAEVLLGSEVRTIDQMKDAAKKLHAIGPRYVLVKGGHLETEAVDVFYDGKALCALEGERIDGADSHGSGCVLSAAIAAYLALGRDVEASVRLAKTFTRDAIRRRLDIGKGPPVSNPSGI